MSRVWIVEAEHFNVPGRVLKVFATEGAAIVEAVDLVNIMLKDDDKPADATAETWEDRAQEMQDEHEDECYVQLDEHEVAA